MAQQQYKGIAGWLAVLATFQVLGLLYRVAGLAGNLSSISRSFATQPVVFGYALAADLAVVTLTLYCTLLLFRRRQPFPSTFRLQLWIVATLHLFDFALRRLLLGSTRSMVYETAEMVGLVTIAIVGSLYTLQSVRVRNTFVG